MSPLHRKLPGKLFGLLAAVMWLGAACTTLVKADRSKVPDDLYHPTDAGVGGASGGGVGGATGSDGGDVAVGDAADAIPAIDAADAASDVASEAAGLDVPPVDGNVLDLSLLDGSDGG